MSEPILSIESAHVSYGRVHAARDVSIEVPEGGLVALIGANGAGKSSVLAAIAGLVRPKSGKVRFAGRDITHRAVHRRVADGLVLVPEGRQILGSLTVAENLRLGAHGRRRHAAGESEMYELFPVLGQRRSLAAGSLSGGEQQMLAIARAMIARPRVVLLDEPSMGLAPKVVDEVFSVIERIRAGGTTMILVEQNARRALRVADTGYVLETGEIVHSGASSELLADPRVVKAYLGVE
ncbi:ABC transporter ATP-binding protein [Glycomyces tarimensis]